ncbi:Flp family type IVb pilin [Devosia oryziradicis]|uniref:Flp family type IVb pilin n=2 Tax=Devosia oryziradicis TaxID=2801335 RepID=A0ABX7BYM2_9HYPH|nr:Flp family type IVb pilin [Devosia oryziradicis]
MWAEMINRFRKDENGATAIEYGLIAALIAVALLASFAILGNSLVNLMSAGTGSASDVIGAQTDKMD